MENDQKAVPVAIISAVASILVALVSGYLSYSAQLQTLKTQDQYHSLVATTDNRINQVAQGSVGTLEQGQKLCRVFAGNTWRYGIIVPQNWNVTLCSDYTKKTGGTKFQLGCIRTDGTNLAQPDGSLPSPNCGWN